MAVIDTRLENRLECDEHDWLIKKMYIFRKRIVREKENAIETETKTNTGKKSETTFMEIFVVKKKIWSTEDIEAEMIFIGMTTIEGND